MGIMNPRLRRVNLNTVSEFDQSPERPRSQAASTTCKSIDRWADLLFFHNPRVYPQGQCTIRLTLTRSSLVSRQITFHVPEGR
jgi:hypothetical protein